MDFEIYNFFIDRPMLIPAWRVSAIKADRTHRKLRFTSNQSIRIEISESKSKPGVFEIKVFRGIYNVKDEIKFREKHQEDIEIKLNEIILEFMQKTRKENSELSKMKYRAKNLK
jgi:hypothetical protein